jgi:hypothetical protein
MNNDKPEISIELSRLIDRQTKFFEKSDPTPSELQEFEWAGHCIRNATWWLVRYRAERPDRTVSSTMISCNLRCRSACLSISDTV